MRKRGTRNKKYSGEFKLSVIIREHCLSYGEIVRKYCLGNIEGTREMLKRWERIYLEKGEAGLSVERRGRSYKMGGEKRGRSRTSH
ncbi:MAG: hypothetical protein GX304_03945 [Clostridiales bacterium]|jgi:hypothetical protein|nr:hypothetical protein [Clostridiales bacterium]